MVSPESSRIPVVLEFRIDERVLEEDLEVYLKDSWSRDALDVTYFIMPVRLAIGGVEMLEWLGRDAGPSDVWCDLCLLDVAGRGLECVRSLEDNTQARYSSLEDAIELKLQRHGDTVRVRSSENDREATVGYEDLLNAFEGFARNVKQALLKAFPGFRNDEGLGAWFSSDEV